MNKIVEKGLPCPCGESSDAYVLREDGSGFCFSGKCGGRNFPINKKEYEELSDEYTARVYPHRGISHKIFNKFNVLTKFKDETPISVGFTYPNGAVQVRELAEKKFYSVGPMSEADLYLKNYFDKGSKRVITITEGNYDALTVAEILGEETAAVAVKSSSTALAECKKNWEYINSFEKIIINFDNDEPGQIAAKKVLSLFDFKKTYNLVLEKHKDANGYIWDIESNREIDDRKAYYEAWRSVRRHTPDNILSGNSDFRKALEVERESCIGSYPFKGLQSKLFGIHEGEYILFKGDEGMGKTEVFRAIENSIIKNTKHPIGIIHLEEDNGTTLRGLVSYYADIPAHVPNTHISTDDVFKILQDINGPNEDRIFLRSSFDVEDEDAFINGIRFLVSVCGCKFIFLDHISWLATGEDNQDERKKLDRISQRLKLLAKELKFALILISHVNDDGKTRGSRNITKVANTVVHLFRDKTNADEVERNKLHFMIEKARLIGAKEGPAGYGYYDEELCILRDPEDMGMKAPEGV